MGNQSSTSKPQISTTEVSTEAPVTSSAPAPSFTNPKKEHLILVFFAGVLLTLLLVALIFIIIKVCRKRYSRSQAQVQAQAQAPVSESPTKLSSVSKESLTYASMTFKPSEESNNNLARSHSTGLDTTVYSQIKKADLDLPLQ